MPLGPATRLSVTRPFGPMWIELMRLQTKRKGVAAVEFALVAPVLCMAFLGMIEVSRAIQVQMVLSNAVREGCRGYADNIATDAAGYQIGTQACVQPIINDMLTGANIGIDTSKVTVTATSPTAVTVAGIPMNQVTVTASLPYSSVAYFAGFYIKRPLTATVTMKKS
jgi:Flp pilus assembly protein TadG